MANNEQVMNELMQSLANQVRVVSGKTELMGIETMANTLNTENSVLNSKLNVQSDLITQIETALEGKVGGTSIPDGYHDVSEVTASKWDVLEGVKFVNKNGNVITGAMPVRESYDTILDTTITTHMIPAGYHEGDGSVSIVLEEKTVTPTDAQQIIMPSEGCVLSQVTVEAAESNGVELPDLTNEGSADDLMHSKELIGSDGQVVVGTFTIDTELEAQRLLINELKASLTEKVGNSEGSEGDISNTIDTRYLYGLIERTIVTIDIPDGITRIGTGAFSQCIYLMNVVIPDSVTIIHNNAFSNCASLRSATIGSSVSSIGVRAFERCDLLSEIVIPDSVTTIGEGTFKDCTSLTSVTIGSGISSIGTDAFFGCSDLTSVTITATTPPSLASIYCFPSIGTGHITFYVPIASVDAYKSATNWSRYADYIQPIDE